jgi:hypothetical protein
MKNQIKATIILLIFHGLNFLLNLSPAVLGQNSISNSEILFDDYSDSGMPVTESPTTTSTTTTTTTTTSTSTASPALVSLRPSPWLTIPESAFPFPLIPASGPIRAIAVLQGNSDMRGAIVFDQRSPNEVRKDNILSKRSQAPSVTINDIGFFSAFAGSYYFCKAFRA